MKENVIVNLYVFFRCNSQIEIENIGEHPITSLSVSIDEKENSVQLEDLVAEDVKKIFEWDPSILANCLPLQSQQKVILPITIRGYKPANKKHIEATFIFEYSSENTKEYYRKHPLTCLVNVMEGLQLLNFEVLPSEANTTSVSSVLASPAFERHKLTDSSRQLMKKIGKLQQTQTMCLLMFEVLNKTSHMFWVKYYVCNNNKNHNNNNDNEQFQPNETIVTMAPHSGRRLMIPFQRFNIQKENIQKVILQSELRQFVRSDSNLTPEQEYEVRYHYLIKQELIKNVHVSWKSDFQTSGILSLSKLRLKPDHVAKLTPDALYFTFRSNLLASMDKNSEKSKSLAKNNGNLLILQPSVEEFSTIFISIKNCSDSIISVNAKCIICEDLGNGMHNMDAHDKFLWTGALDFDVLEVDNT